jgi:predicted Zn-ribbon and HTH transcriptional regulator
MAGGSEEQMLTIRQKMIRLLEQETMSARELSKALSISEKEIIAHLDHAAKSVQPPKRLIIEPSTCQRCGFVFRNRRRFSSPSRCPECRHEGITRPEFSIRIY